MSTPNQKTEYPFSCAPTVEIAENNGSKTALEQVFKEACELQHPTKSRQEVLEFAKHLQANLPILKSEKEMEAFCDFLSELIEIALPHLPAQNRSYWQDIKRTAVDMRPQSDSGAIRMISLNTDYYLELIQNLILEVRLKERLDILEARRMELVWEIDRFLQSTVFFITDGLSLIKRSKQFLSAEDADYYLGAFDNCNGCYLQIMQNTDVDFDNEGALDSLKKEVWRHLERLVEILNS